MCMRRRIWWRWLLEWYGHVLPRLFSNPPAVCHVYDINRVFRSVACLLWLQDAILVRLVLMTSLWISGRGSRYLQVSTCLWDRKGVRRETGRGKTEITCGEMDRKVSYLDDLPLFYAAIPFDGFLQASLFSELHVELQVKLLCCFQFLRVIVRSHGLVFFL